MLIMLVCLKFQINVTIIISIFESIVYNEKKHTESIKYEKEKNMNSPNAKLG